MSKTRLIPWVVLACIGTLTACTSSEDGTAGNTELNVVVPNGTTNGSSAPAPIDIQSVEYTINCDGDANGPFLDNDATFVNAVTINGNLEVVDGRTLAPGAPGSNRCNGGDNPGAPCNTPASPSLECQGTSPVPDGSCVSTADFGPGLPNNQSEIWQGFMDLPPGPCNVQLRARDADQEVICTNDQGFSVVADTTTKVNLVLYCGLSFQAPVGMLDLDATFSFNVANFCPDLFVFNAIDSAPAEQPIFVPALGATLNLAITTMEARFRDGDNQCGDSCDPQTCTPTADGLDCSPAPEPADGVITTITCTSLYCQDGANPGAPCLSDADCVGNPAAGIADGTCPGVQTALTDCNFNLVPDVIEGYECVLTSNAAGEYLGILQNPPIAPPNTPANPNLNASGLIGCVPPTGIPPVLPPGAPGANITCTAVTTDGDTDCDKVKTFELACPGLTPCGQYAADGFVCDDGNDCTTDSCNDAGAVGGSCGSADNGSCCEATNVADGATCTSAPAPAQCQSGVCTSQSCVVNGCPDDGNVCTAPQTCNTVTTLCEPNPPAGEPTGTCSITTGTTCAQDSDCPGTETCNNNTCSIGSLGPNSGNCNGAGACQPICDFNPACVTGYCSTATTTPCGDDADCPTGETCNTATPAQCQVATCDPADGTCGTAPGPNGTTCDFNPGAGDGTCQAGTCIFTPPTCNADNGGGSAQSQIVSVGCVNNVTTAQSPFPFVLSVDAPVAIIGGASFSVTLDGIGFFPEFFLDAAQNVVPGGVRVAQLVAFVSTVHVASGATGPDVPLQADPATLTPGPVRFCDFPATTVCTCPPGTPDASTCANAACLGGTCTAVKVLQDLPVIDGIPGSAGGCDSQGGTVAPPDCDCSPCDAINAVKAGECAINGFCQNGDLVIQFAAQTGTYTAGASGGDVLWGWTNNGTVCPAAAPFCAGAPFYVAGCMDIPPAGPNAPAFGSSPAPIGIRVNASGLAVPIQCAMGVDGGSCSVTTTQGCTSDGDCPGTETCIGVGVDDDIICPTPDSALISCPIN